MSMLKVCRRLGGGNGRRGSTRNDREVPGRSRAQRQCGAADAQEARRKFECSCRTKEVGSACRGAWIAVRRGPGRVVVSRSSRCISSCRCCGGAAEKGGWGRRGRGGDKDENESQDQDL